MELTSKQIQEIQDELDRAVKIQLRIAGLDHPYDLDNAGYARWAYWNGKEVQVRKIQKILGLWGASDGRKNTKGQKTGRTKDNRFETVKHIRS